jgi:hypothetical protein
MLGLVLAIGIPLLVGVLLLILEYRTGWFANRLSVRSSAGTDLRSDRGWAETICKVRQNLGRIYALDPDEIRVLSWEPKDRGKRIRLEAKTADGGRYIVWADRAGRILHSRDHLALPPPVRGGRGRNYS